MDNLPPHEPHGYPQAFLQLVRPSSIIGMRPPTSAETITVHTGRLRQTADRIDTAADQLAREVKRGHELAAVPPGWASSIALERLSIAIASSLALFADRTQSTGTALRRAATAYEESDGSAMGGGR